MHEEQDTKQRISGECRLEATLPRRDALPLEKLRLRLDLRITPWSSQPDRDVSRATAPQGRRALPQSLSFASLGFASLRSRRYAVVAGSVVALAILVWFASARRWPAGLGEPSSRPSPGATKLEPPARARPAVAPVVPPAPAVPSSEIEPKRTVTPVPGWRPAPPVELPAARSTKEKAPVLPTGSRAVRLPPTRAPAPAREAVPRASAIGVDRNSKAAPLPLTSPDVRASGVRAVARPQPATDDRLDLFGDTK
jgi:hypothetical protein